eukprot:COSAG02_NODE_6920_length_3287_cov_4.293915_1_plen_502_part_00
MRSNRRDGLFQSLLRGLRWAGAMATFSFGTKQSRSEDDGEEGGGKRKTPAFSFGDTSKPAGAGATGGFVFGGGSTPAASPKGAAPPFAFGSSGGGGGGGDDDDEKKKPPAFSFGSSSGSSGGTSTGFSFGAKPASGAGGGGGGGFAFKVAAPPTAADDDDDEDQKPEPDQKPEVTKSEANENEEVIDWSGSEARAALHTLTDTKEELESQLKQVQQSVQDGVKDGMTVEEATALLEAGQKAKFKQWKKKGVSTIALVKDKPSGNLMLRMRSENGQQVLLNDWAHKTKTTKLADKKMTMITAAGASHMLRFGKQETRDELFEYVVTHSLLYQLRSTLFSATQRFHGEPAACSLLSCSCCTGGCVRPLAACYMAARQSLPPPYRAQKQHPQPPLPPSRSQPAWQRSGQQTITPQRTPIRVRPHHHPSASAPKRLLYRQPQTPVPVQCLPQGWAWRSAPSRRLRLLVRKLCHSVALARRVESRVQRVGAPPAEARLRPVVAVPF